MKYRARLIDHNFKRERPVEAYFNSRREADEWAKTVLTTVAVSPLAVVNIYMTTEEQVAMFMKKAVESAA